MGWRTPLPFDPPRACYMLIWRVLQRRVPLANPNNLLRFVGISDFIDQLPVGSDGSYTCALPILAEHRPIIGYCRGEAELVRVGNRHDASQNESTICTTSIVAAAELRSRRTSFTYVVCRETVYSLPTQWHSTIGTIRILFESTYLSIAPSRQCIKRSL